MTLSPATPLPGIRSATVDTDRIRMHYLDLGPAYRRPIVMHRESPVSSRRVAPAPGRIG